MHLSKHGNRFHYDISAKVQFTARDLRILKRCSELHYDHTCKNIFSSGPRAFGNVMGAYFQVGEGYVDPLDPEVPAELVSNPYTVSWDKLDIMLKTLECASYDKAIAGEAVSLSYRIRDVLRALTSEWERISDKIPADNVPVERMEVRCGMSTAGLVTVTHSLRETIEDEDYDVLHVRENTPEDVRERDLVFKRKVGTRGWFWWRSRDGEPLWNCGRCVSLEAV